MQQQITFKSGDRDYSLSQDASDFIKYILESQNPIVQGILALITSSTPQQQSPTLQPDEQFTGDEIFTRSASLAPKKFEVKKPLVNKKVFLYEPKKAFTYLIGGVKTTYISTFSPEILEQSFTLNADTALPYMVLKPELIKKYNLLSTDKYYHTRDNINKRFIRFNGCKRQRKIAQSKYFVFDGKKKGELESSSEPKAEVMQKIIELLKETGAVMAGSYPLSKFHKNIEPDDIDVFSFTLDFFRLFLEYFFENESLTSGEIHHKLFFRRVNEVNSFKFSLYNGDEEYFKLNFIHFAENPKDEFPQDIKLLTEENRTKTLQRIEQNFDNTVCMTSYDGEFFHFNWDAIFGKKVYGRNLFQHRIEKYTERGYTLIQPPDVSDEDNQAVEFYHSRSN